jgi:sulfate adenylyltransferase large subunit
MGAAAFSMADGLPAAVEDKELLRLAVVGSVDDGKSTLIGRILFDCGGLFEDQVEAVRRATARRVAQLPPAGGEAVARPDGELDLSLFTDGLKAEREQGITIDVAYRYFSTARRKIIVADTPGHLQYTRNMATGASTADAAVILVDARLGVLPQTRRHAYIASLLGIPYLAVAINKMDLVGFDPEVFRRIAAELGRFALTLGFAELRLFPVSAAAGDNVTVPSPRTPWHAGGTLLQWLEALPHQRRLDEAPFRFPVQYVIRPDLNYRGLAGQVVSGKVRVGDELLVLPAGRQARVSAIDTFDGPLQEVEAPAAAVLRLGEELDISRGDLLAAPGEPPLRLSRLDATLVWFGERPLNPAQRYLVKHTTRTVSAQVEQVLWRKELDDLSEQPAETLALNEIGRVRLACKRPLLCDPYLQNRHTGAFILIDPLTHDTVAAGMVVGPAADAQPGELAASQITPEERRLRLGQRGAIVRVPDGAGAVQQAFGLERRLFERGLVATVVDGDVDAALAIAEAGLVALVCLRTPQAVRFLQEQRKDHLTATIDLAPDADLESWVLQVAASQEDAP